MTHQAFDLSGRTALVTGAGQGVGAEIAATLAAHGAKLVVNDFFPDRAAAVAGAITKGGGRAIAVQADVGDAASVMALVREAEEALGPIDVLVNNAGNGGPDGAMERTAFWDSDPAEWDRYLRVNLFGVLNCARACSGGMVARGWGRIITIVSDAGRVGEQGYEAYSAAKAGAAGFSRALARSLGRHGITANTISLSNMRRAGPEPTAEVQAQIRQALSRYIVRRQGRPSDVAPLVLLLASDAGEWITGQNYPVNGGYSLAL